MGAGGGKFLSVTPESYDSSDLASAEELEFELFVNRPSDLEANEVGLAQARAIGAVLQWIRDQRRRMNGEVGEDGIDWSEDERRSA